MDVRIVLGAYGIAVGVLVIAQWAASFRAGRIPELVTTPRAIRFHLLAEGLMALALIAAGSLTIARQPIGPPLLAIAFGMTLYSIVNSSGYFAERREMPPLAMFAALFVVTLAASLALFTLD